MKRNLSEAHKILHLYEMIIIIIDQNGPTSIPSICQQINNHSIFMKNRNKPVQSTQIKSVLSRKKDLFTVKDEIVCIRPEREIVSLKIGFGESFSPWYKICVDFKRKNFIYFEMNLDSSNRLAYDPVEAGNIDDFKQEIFRLKIWDWESNYEPEGIILDGISWSVELQTKGETFKKEGLKLFPKEWAKFCRSLTKLIGKKCI